MNTDGLPQSVRNNAIFYYGIHTSSVPPLFAKKKPQCRNTEVDRRVILSCNWQNKVSQRCHLLIYPPLGFEPPAPAKWIVMVGRQVHREMVPHADLEVRDDDVQRCDHLVVIASANDIGVLAPQQCVPLGPEILTPIVIRSAAEVAECSMFVASYPLGSSLHRVCGNSAFGIDRRKYVMAYLL